MPQALSGSFSGQNKVLGMPTLVVSNISCEHSEVPFIQYIQYLNIHHYPHHHHQHHHHDQGVGRAYV